MCHQLKLHENFICVCVCVLISQLRLRALSVREGDAIVPP